MKLSRKLFLFVIFVNLLWGCRTWLFWDISEDFKLTLIIRFLVCLICFAYQMSHKIKLPRNPKFIMGTICFYIAYLWMKRDILFTIEGLLFYYPLMVLYADCENSSNNLRSLNKYVAIALTPAIALFLYFSIREEFPPSLIIKCPGNDSYYFFNYIFLLKPVDRFDLVRFQAFCLEPGYLGIMCAYLLYADRFRLKFIPNIVLLVALILSFSLNAYIIAQMGFVLLNSKAKLLLRNIVITTILLISVYGFSQLYREGDNYVNNLIIERLMPDEDKGIAGNNRSSETTDYYFEKGLTDGSLLFGLSREKLKRINGRGFSGNQEDGGIRGAGFKQFAVINGFLVMILLFIWYLQIAKMSRPQDKLYSVTFLCMIIISFIPAADACSYSWLIPYILGQNSRKWDRRRK